MDSNSVAPATDKDRRQLEITETIRNSPEIAEVLEKMDALADRLAPDGIAAWQVMQVLEGALRMSPFGEKARKSVL